MNWCILEVIVILNLTLSNKNEIYEIIISNNNKILFQKKEDLINFFQFFYDVFEKNSNDTKITINNSLINNKEYIFINLIDINSILYNFKYIKGTIFYEYIDISINDINIKNQINLEKNINKINDQIVNDKHLNIFYENNSIFDKIFRSVIKYSLCQNENIFNDIIYMLKRVINFYNNKKVIIFYDSSVFNINININNDNIYYFDINQSQYFKKYNILLINKEIKNFNGDILIDNINNICPIGRIKSINFYVNKYFLCYFKNNNIFMTEENEILIFNIINKLYNLNKKMIFNIKINNIIKSYINK